MRFKRILFLGRNRISKIELQLKNYKNFGEILEYIENYRKKNDELCRG